MVHENWLKIYDGKNDEKLETVDENRSLILLENNVINVQYVFHTKNPPLHLLLLASVEI